MRIISVPTAISSTTNDLRKKHFLKQWQILGIFYIKPGSGHKWLSTCSNSHPSKKKEKSSCFDYQLTALYRKIDILQCTVPKGNKNVKVRNTTDKAFPGRFHCTLVNQTLPLFIWTSARNNCYLTACLEACSTWVCSHLLPDKQAFARKQKLHTVKRRGRAAWSWTKTVDEAGFFSHSNFPTVKLQPP